MNYDKFFEIAKQEGLENLELYVTKRENLKFSLFHGELDSYSLSDSFSISARGVFNGKMGYASSEKLDSTSARYLVEQIVENAKIIDKPAPEIFKGSKVYKKKNIYNIELAKTDVEKKIAILKEIESGIKNKDSRITDVECEYNENSEEISIYNSYGLKLKSKSNYYLVYGSAVAVDEKGTTKNGYSIKLDNDINKLDVEKMVNEAVEKTISQFGGEPCESKKYKTILASSVASNLLSFLLENMSADNVQKNMSLLKDKVGTAIASKKLTVSELPLEKNLFFRYFDDEGVATMNKVLIKKGILQTYLYNLETAKKDGVESTGNGYKTGGGKISTSCNNVKVHPGKKSLEQLFEVVGDGIYITSVTGLHSGMNPQSGNFSLQASGFLIEGGKKTTPVCLITVAGNIFDLFLNIKEIGSDIELHTNSIATPSLFIKKLAISGK